MIHIVIYFGLLFEELCSFTQKNELDIEYRKDFGVYERETIYNKYLSCYDSISFINLCIFSIYTYGMPFFEENVLYLIGLLDDQHFSSILGGLQTILTKKIRCSSLKNFCIMIIWNIINA